MPLEQVKLTARTLYCGPIAMSMEVAQDAPNIDATLQHSMTQAVALGLDYAALAGDGSGATPIGVLYADRVKDMSPIWTPFDNHDDFSWAVEYLMGANCNIDNASVVMPPAVYAGLDRLKDTLHQPLQPPASYAGLKKFVSNQISMDTGIGDASSPTTACIVGDFTQMLIGMRLELQIQSTYQAYDAFARAQIWVRAILRADVALAHPEHFARMTGLTGYSDDMPSI
jgi:HK97 family phage major capsid protein